MKNLKLGLAALILSLFYVVTPAQFLGPPSAYRDTASVGDSAKMIWQIGPPFSPVKIRSQTMAQLTSEIAFNLDTLAVTCGAGLNCDSTGTGKLVRQRNDSLTGRTKIDSGIVQFLNNTNVAPGGTEGLGFGWEYLYHIRDMWMDIFLGLSETVPIIVLAGDSNMNGDGVDNQIFKPEYGLTEVFVQSGFDKPDIRKMSVNGSTVKDWVLNSLPAQIAVHPDALILRTWINRVISTPDSTEYWTRRGLQTLRDSLGDVNDFTCILEMPSAVPDSAYQLTLEPMLRAVARDYQCVFIDTRTMWRDNLHGGNNWIEDRIHPTDVLSMAIVGQMGDVIAPNYIRQMMGNTVFRNMKTEAPISDVNTLNSWFRPVWPKGISMYSVTLPSAAQYPVDGAVIAFVSSNTKMMQFDFGPAGLGVRMGDTATGFGGWNFPLMANDTGLIGVPKAFTSYQFTRSIKATGGVTVTGGLDANSLNVSGATTLNTLHTTGNGTVDGSLTIKGIDGLAVSGPEGVAGTLYIQADEGDDNADVWSQSANPDGTFALKSYDGGGHNVLSFVGSTSAATFTGNVSAPSFNTSSAAVAGTGTMILGTTSPCPSGTMTWIPHQSAGVNGYITWCHP